MLKQDDFIKAQLVAVGWRFGQSYSGGHLAAQMVMNVIGNRFRVWGLPWLDCIENVPTHMAENELPPLKFPSVWDQNFVKLLHSVDAAFEGTLQDMTKGALYWGDLSRIERPWFKEKIIQARKEDVNGDLVPVHPRVADLNGLSFWK